MNGNGNGQEVSASRTAPGKHDRAAAVPQSLGDRLTGLGPYLSDVVRQVDMAPTRPGEDTEWFELTIEADWIAELFEVDDEEARSQASHGGFLLYAHTALQDHRIDDELPEPALATGIDLLCNVLLVESLGRLSAVARGDSRFWSTARAAFDQLASACADEPALGLVLGAEDARERVIALLAERVATVRVVVAALACCSGRHERVDAVIRGLDRLLVAIQIRDGVSDWRADHGRSRNSYVLLRLAERIGKDLADCTSDELADELYLLGGIEALVDEIQGYLKDAVEQVREYPHQGLSDYVAAFSAECRALVESVQSRKAAAMRQLPRTE